MVNCSRVLYSYANRLDMKIWNVFDCNFAQVVDRQRMRMYILLTYLSFQQLANQITQPIDVADSTGGIFFFLAADIPHHRLLIFNNISWRTPLDWRAQKVKRKSQSMPKNKWNKQKATGTTDNNPFWYALLTSNNMSEIKILEKAKKKEKIPLDTCTRCKLIVFV